MLNQTSRIVCRRRHTSEIYNSLFEGVYKRMYTMLKPLYRPLKKIVR